MQSHPLVPNAELKYTFLGPHPRPPNANCWGPLGNPLCTEIGICSSTADLWLWHIFLILEVIKTFLRPHK